MAKSSFDATAAPRKQWTPPKPSYCSPKPLVSPRSVTSSPQLPHAYFPPASSTSRDSSHRPTLQSSPSHLLGHRSKQPSISSIHSVPTSSSPLAERRQANKPSPLVASLPLQPLRSDPSDEDETTLPETTISRLQQWSFERSASLDSARPSAPLLQPSSRFVEAACSPKSRLEPAIFSPFAVVSPHKVSVFESWEDDQEERLQVTPPMTPVITDGRTSRSRSHSTSIKAPLRFFSSPSKRASRDLSIGAESMDESTWSSSGPSPVEGHSAAGTPSKLRQLSHFVRQSSTLSIKRTTSESPSDIFFDSRVGKDGFALAADSNTPASLQQHGSMQRSSSDNTILGLFGSRNVGLGLDCASLGFDLPGSSTAVRPATPDEVRNGSPMVASTSQDQARVPTLRFDQKRRPRAPFPASTTYPSTMRERPEPVAPRNASPPIPPFAAIPLRPIPVKAATLLGTLPGTMYASKKVKKSSMPAPSVQAIVPLTTSKNALTSPGLPPCPDRMHKLHEMVRSKGSRAAKASAEPPSRPTRPTQDNIFAAVLDDNPRTSTSSPASAQNEVSVTSMAFPLPPLTVPTAATLRSARMAKRSPGPPPPPKIPLPPVPKLPDTIGDVSKPAAHSGWKRETVRSTLIASEEDAKQLPLKSTVTTRFEGKLINIGYGGAANNRKDSITVTLDVGGMSFVSTLGMLFPEHVPVSSYGLASWLNKVHLSAQKSLAEPHDGLAPPLDASLPRHRAHGSRNTVNSYDSGNSLDGSEDEDKDGEGAGEEEIGSVSSLSSSTSSNASQTDLETPVTQSPYTFNAALAKEHPRMSVKDRLLAAAASPGRRRSHVAPAPLNIRTAHDPMDPMHSGLALTPNSVSVDGEFEAQLALDARGMSEDDSDEDTYERAANEVWRAIHAIQQSHGETRWSLSSSQRPTSSASDLAFLAHANVSNSSSKNSSKTIVRAHRRSSSTPSRLMSACLTPTKPLGVGGAGSDVPTFVFSPTPRSTDDGDASAEGPCRAGVASLHVALPEERNPFCYPVILHALQHDSLPAYFDRAHRRGGREAERLAALLDDVSQEAAWLGYTHLVTLVHRHIP